jgi:hypothetical protein
MSLTSFLQNKDVKERFRQEFQKPRFSMKEDLLAPPLTTHYGLVGTAFDYLLRFYIKRLNPDAVDKGPWIAEAAIPLIGRDLRLRAMAEKIVSQAKERLSAFLETGKIGDDLLESALLLAGLDPIFRAGIGHEYIGRVDSDDLQDSRNLLSIVDPETFKARELCLLNPTFGEASVLVGGADADLLIDDVLVDIKTTKSPALQRRDFDQLIGYYVLHEIAGIGELVPKPDIRKVAIYFSRYAYLYILDVEQIVDRESLPAFMLWFENRAKEQYKIVGRLS